MAKSPYLSEEVLQELAEKENFPPALIRDIMVANKHAGKDVNVIDNLENRNNELPDYMMEQIKTAAESGASAKEILESMIAQKAANYKTAVDAQIDVLAADTLTTLADYDAVLATAEGLEYKTKQTALHLQYGTVQTAAAIVQNLSAYSAAGAAEQAMLTDYTALYTILLSIKQRGGNVDSLSTQELTNLQTLAGNLWQAIITRRKPKRAP